MMKTISSLVPLMVLAAVSVPAHSAMVYDKATSGVANDGATVGSIALSTSAKYGDGAVHSVNGSLSDGLYIGGDLTDLDQIGDFSAMAWVKVNAVNDGNGVLALGSCCSSGDVVNGHQN